MTDVKRTFNATVSTLACIVFILLVIIAVLIWRARRVLPNNRATTTHKVITDNVGQPDSPRDQHESEPGSYMELHPKPSEGQSHAPPEYTRLLGKDENTEYYNVEFCKRDNGRKCTATYMELQPSPSEEQSLALPEYKSLQGTNKNPVYCNVEFNNGNKRNEREEICDKIGNVKC